jgi:hypothetical protein
MRTHYELALSLGPLSSSNLDSEPLEWIDACLDRNLQVVERETPVLATFDIQREKGKFPSSITSSLNP